MASRTLGSQTNAVWQMAELPRGRRKAISDAKLERGNVSPEWGREGAPCSVWKQQMDPELQSCLIISRSQPCQSLEPKLRTNAPGEGHGLTRTRHSIYGFADVLEAKCGFPVGLYNLG